MKFTQYVPKESLLAGPAGARVLVVDDEEATGEAALVAAIDDPPDLVILDLMLPDMDGIEVCRELRTWLAAPILVLSVRSGEADKVRALDEGADDYLTKPFSAGELLARLRALLRRVATQYAPPPIVTAGDLTVDVARRVVTLAGEPVTLTPTEFDILALLARNADCVVTQKAILEQIWGPEWAEDRQTLRAHVSNLRRKIEIGPGKRRYVLTEPGVGFRFSTGEAGTGR